MLLASAPSDTTEPTKEIQSNLDKQGPISTKVCFNSVKFVRFVFKVNSTLQDNNSSLLCINMELHIELPLTLVESESFM